MSSTLLIAILARLFSLAPLAPPSNDECAGAMQIVGKGEYLFVNSDATTSLPEAVCDSFPYSEDPSFKADVWYCWTADCAGPVTIDTCGSTIADTRIAIYEGCDCPSGSFLICSDNECAEQSKLEFTAVKNQQYLIRIGSVPRRSSDSDSFRIACRRYDDPWQGVSFPCDHLNDPSTYSPTCKYRSNWDALNSTRGVLSIVDDFVPEATGSINHACWAGVYLKNAEECIRYLPDEIEITYYADDCGSPGGLLAGPFSQNEETLVVTGPLMTNVDLPGGVQEFEYGAEHPPVPVMEGQTYWVEITNSPFGQCEWYWETSPGNSGYSIQIDDWNQSMTVVQNDLSFCFDVRHEDAPFCSSTIVLNDECDSAIPLSPGTVEFDTMAATTNDPFLTLPRSPHAEPTPRVDNDDFPLGDERLHKDIWFDLQYPCSGKARFSVCDSSFDTKLAVFLGSFCPTSTIIARSDDDCGIENLRSMVEVTVSDVLHYKVNVGGYDGAWGDGVLDFQYVPPDSPTLLEFAALSRCFTGSCTPPCGPFPMDCCDVHDFDADSDVDLRDARDLLEVLTGPE